MKKYISIRNKNLPITDILKLAAKIDVPASKIIRAAIREGIESLKRKPISHIKIQTKE
jgi:hypothetical protein